MSNNYVYLSFLIFLTGGLGALIRSTVIDLAAKVSNYIPYGVIIVNSMATFLAVLAFDIFPKDLAVVLVSGFIVALGTLSSLCGDALNLLRQKHFKKFFLYIGLNALMGLLSAIVANYISYEFFK